MGEEAGLGDMKPGRDRLLWIMGAWLHGVALPHPWLLPGTPTAEDLVGVAEESCS